MKVKCSTSEHARKFALMSAAEVIWTIPVGFVVSLVAWALPPGKQAMGFIWTAVPGSWAGSRNGLARRRC